MSEETPAEQEIERVLKHVLELMEHFDTVQIFCTRLEDDEAEGGTTSVNIGRGNYWARNGVVKGWIKKEDERLRKEVQEEESD